MLGEVRRITSGSSPDTRRYGIMLSIVEPRQRELLRTLITTLAEESGIADREHTRVYRRIELLCRSKHETRAIMSDLSKGGLAFFSPVPLMLDEMVTVTIKLDGFGQLLDVDGRVVHARQTKDGYHVGIQFQEQSAQGKESVASLLRFLIDCRDEE